MSSILTNTGAMVALQTLQTTNRNLDDVQNQISTGKKVANARDNAAIWAISSVMESDVAGFKAISETLALGKSTVALARGASEQVTELLEEMKTKIVSAQEDNVDRAKIQTDVAALRDQVNSIVGAAQFNGLNLLQGTDDVDILASLDRDSSGNISTSNITVGRQNLETSAGVFGSSGALSNITAGAAAVVNTANTLNVTIGGTIAVGEDFSVTLAGQTLTFTSTATTVDNVVDGLAGLINTAGIEGVTASNATGGVLEFSSVNAFTEFSVTTAEASAAGTITAGGTLDRRAETITLGAGNVTEGDSYRVTVGGTNYDYVAGKNETMNDVAVGLKAAIDSSAPESISVQVNQTTNPSTDGATLYIDNNSTSLTLAASDNSGGTANGGLFAMGSIDVSTETGATRALENIESLIETSIAAAASFGSDEKRIDTQNSFVSTLVDSMKAGIGSLVDANMEEASARLQALQVQQQLGIQALSIANQAPQNILSLFR